MTPQLRFPEFTDEWQVKKLGESLESISSGKSNTTSNGTKYPIYGSTGEIGKSATCDYSGDKLLIARVGANAGSMYRVSGSYKVSDNTLIVNLKDDVDTSFVQYSLINFNINRLVFGSGQPLVTGGMLKNTKFAFPSKPEQEKIADFLTAVDERIAVGEKKLKLLETYKRGVMQQIFSQKIRFKDENGNPYPDWEEKKLEDVFSERDGKGGEIENMLSVTIKSGVVPFSTIDRKDNSPANKINYKKVVTGDIAYNSMRMWQGASGVSAYDGIVSPAYTVITPKADNVSKFWGYYFKLPRVVFTFERYSQGLTSDTWNLKFKQLSEIALSTPSEEEQQKIADFLTTLDARITAEKSKLTAARQFKKALLQRMFV